MLSLNRLYLDFKACPSLEDVLETEARDETLSEDSWCVGVGRMMEAGSDVSRVGAVSEDGWEVGVGRLEAAEGGLLTK